MHDIQELNDSLQRVSEYFEIYADNSGKIQESRGRKIFIPEGNLAGVYDRIALVLTSINLLLQFDLNYKSPDHLTDMLGIERTPHSKWQHNLMWDRII